MSSEGEDTGPGQACRRIFQGNAVRSVAVENNGFLQSSSRRWWLRRWKVEGRRYEPVSLSFPGEGEEAFAPRGGRSFPRASLPWAPGLRPASWRCRPKHVKCTFSLFNPLCAYINHCPSL